MASIIKEFNMQKDYYADLMKYWSEKDSSFAEFCRAKYLAYNEALDTVLRSLQ